MVYDLKFGEFIEHRRKAERLPMKSFADKVGVSPPYLSDIKKVIAQLQTTSPEQSPQDSPLTQDEREPMYDTTTLTRDDQTQYSAVSVGQWVL